MKNHVTLWLLVVLLFFSCQNSSKIQPSHINGYDTIRYKVYRVDSGWGFDILINSKVFIHQPFIPGVQGRFVFLTSNDARKTAVLMIQKMLKQRGLPGVSYRELDSLGVLYDTVKKFQEYILGQHKRYSRVR